MCSRKCFLSLLCNFWLNFNILLYKCLNINFLVQSIFDKLILLIKYQFISGMRKYLSLLPESLELRVTLLYSFQGQETQLNEEVSGAKKLWCKVEFRIKIRGLGMSRNWWVCLSSFVNSVVLKLSCWFISIFLWNAIFATLSY